MWNCVHICPLHFYLYPLHLLSSIYLFIYIYIYRITIWKGSTRLHGWRHTFRTRTTMTFGNTFQWMNTTRTLLSPSTRSLATFTLTVTLPSLCMRYTIYFSIYLSLSHPTASRGRALLLCSSSLLFLLHPFVGGGDYSVTMQMSVGKKWGGFDKSSNGCMELNG